MDERSGDDNPRAEIFRESVYYRQRLVLDEDGTVGERMASGVKREWQRIKYGMKIIER